MTFEVIVTTFLQAHGLSLEAVPLTDGRDEQVAPEVTDEALAERFRAYHNRVATLDFREGQGEPCTVGEAPGEVGAD